METLPSSPFFREQLSGKDNFEIAGTDVATGVGYRVTVRRDSVDISAFSKIDPKKLAASIKTCLPVSIGASRYLIERSIAKKFLQAVKETGRISAVSITLQSQREIFTFIGDNPSKLADIFEVHVPPRLEWEQVTLVEGSRDWGRKIGHAAKDLSCLRGSSFGLNDLEIVERSGDAEAYEAVFKSAVLPSFKLEDLRAKGVHPSVAFGIISCWRMIKQRPNRHPTYRLVYVRDLPLFFASLEQCSTLDEFADTLKTFINQLAKNATAVVGTRLPSFAERISSHSRGYLYSRDLTVRRLLDIEELVDSEAKWSAAAADLGNHVGVRKTNAEPLPERPSLPLDELSRSGLNLPLAPTIDRVAVELGLTGVEFGNYVSNREVSRLSKLVAEAFSDLRQILGDWTTPFCRIGNLSLALGARGKGSASAHYEPSLRVVNLTKTRGDGSLAHEFGHFLDHMLVEFSNDGNSRYLSGRVKRISPNDHPIAVAMHQVMQAISSTSFQEKVLGHVKPNRWFRKRWLDANCPNSRLSPQKCFDRIADVNDHRFRSGRNAKSSSKMLVNSIAKHRGKPVSVDIAYVAESSFRGHARKLGVYWSRREELFARAFESYVEDELVSRGWRSDFLVMGTRGDYTRCRGLPYPIDAERMQINAAIAKLVATIARTGAWN